MTETQTTAVTRTNGADAAVAANAVKRATAKLRKNRAAAKLAGDTVSVPPTAKRGQGRPANTSTPLRWKKLSDAASVCGPFAVAVIEADTVLVYRADTSSAGISVRAKNAAAAKRIAQAIADNAA